MATTSPVEINGNEIYFAFSNGGFNAPVTRYQKRPNGIKVESYHFEGHKAPMSILERCPNGTEIRTIFPGEYAIKNEGITTIITRPNGDSYSRKLKTDGTLEYSKFTQSGWNQVEGSQKYLEAMFKNHLNAARKGYAEVAIK